MHRSLLPIIAPDSAPLLSISSLVPPRMQMKPRLLPERERRTPNPIQDSIMGVLFLRRRDSSHTASRGSVGSATRMTARSLARCRNRRVAVRVNGRRAGADNAVMDDATAAKEGEGRKERAPSRSFSPNLLSFYTTKGSSSLRHSGLTADSSERRCISFHRLSCASNLCRPRAFLGSFVPI